MADGNAGSISIKDADGSRPLDITISITPSKTPAATTPSSESKAPAANTPSSESKAPAATTTPSSSESKDKERLRIFDKSLGTAATLQKLLPTGTTLAFQTMAPSFTKGGQCRGRDVNFVFTWGLIGFLTVLSALLSFTDSVVDKHGNTFYGVATRKGFKLFNHHLRQLELADGEKRNELRRAKKLGPVDFLHAVLSAAVFMALAFCDAGVQGCLVPKESGPWKDFLNNLPLAVGFLASFVLMVFPSTRKGIGDDPAYSPPSPAGTSTDAAGKTPTGTTTDAAAKTPTGTTGDAAKTPTGTTDAATNIFGKRRLFNKSLGTAAGLSKLLPTGTTLAFATMAPSFTKGGECKNHGVNFAFTWGLIGFLTVLCAALSFTDSVRDEYGNTYYGLATPRGLWLFDRPEKMKKGWLPDKDERWKIRTRDWLHAIFSAAVFMTIAFCDAGVQRCLLHEESSQWREFLNLLPLAVGFLATFVFVIFPSNRHGIGEVGVWDTPEEEEPKEGEKKGSKVSPSSNETPSY